MNTVRIFDASGEPFEVAKSRVVGLLAQGWTLTKVDAKPAAVDAKPAAVDAKPAAVDAKPAAVEAKKESEPRSRSQKILREEVSTDDVTED